jgi:tRNA-specific 2-thiouridylase
MQSGKTVYVGLSGGVDSSVAALRLQKQGYVVVGVFIKVWHPDFMVCNWEAERLDAMRAAAHLDIPFLTCDAEDAYKQKVADYFIAEYTAGRTPNPDILCNQSVKFGCFYEYAMERGADFIATGHYVQNINNELHRGVDSDKDQSYFLWTLPQDKLEKCLFPVGDTEKVDIRAEASAAGLNTATKNDSQGICFLGHVDIPEFLSHYTDLHVGSVLNPDGEVIGEHLGALVYTLGQRHGFSIHQQDSKRVPQFVVAKDISSNTITVAPTPLTTEAGHTITIDNTVLRDRVQEGDCIEVQFRYRQEPFTVRVQERSENRIVLSLETTVPMPATGQSCVLYQGSHCIGGGVITS